MLVLVQHSPLSPPLVPWLVPGFDLKRLLRLLRPRLNLPLPPVEVRLALVRFGQV